MKHKSTLDAMNANNNLLAKQTAEVSRNTSAALEMAANIDRGMEALQNELSIANQIADKTARMQEEMTIRARISDEEKQEQKQIKNAVFSYKQDLDIVLKSPVTHLKRYIGLKGLTEIGKSSLSFYTHKLVELNDKEFANNLMNTAYESMNQTFAFLSEEEKNDLRTLEHAHSVMQQYSLAESKCVGLRSKRSSALAKKDSLKPNYGTMDVRILCNLINSILACVVLGTTAGLAYLFPPLRTLTAYLFHIGMGNASKIEEYQRPSDGATKIAVKVTDSILCKLAKVNKKELEQIENELAMIEKNIRDAEVELEKISVPYAQSQQAVSVIFNKHNLH